MDRVTFDDDKQEWEAIVRRREEDLAAIGDDEPSPLWGETQVALGDALTELARRTAWDTGADRKRELLFQAVDAYTQAIPALAESGDDLRLSHAFDMMGRVFAGLARLLPRDEGKAFRRRAMEAYQSATAIRDPDRYPAGYAETQNNLGLCLAESARIAAGEERRDLLEQAVDAHRNALSAPHRWDPDEYASSHHHLANALWSLSAVTVDEGERFTLLEQAVNAYRRCFKVYRPDNEPALYALVRNNLGNALSDLALFFNGPERRERIEEAVDAYRRALTHRTRADFPDDFAMTQNNLGAALSELSQTVAGEERCGVLREVVAAYRAALASMTRKRPDEVAAAQNNLGNALADMGSCLESDEERLAALNESVEAYQQAMAVGPDAGLETLFRAAMNQAVAASHWPDNAPGALPVALRALADLFRLEREAETSRMFVGPRAAQLKNALQEKIARLERG
jgi:tetratricopeptide (TPR) repeat protein